MSHWNLDLQSVSRSTDGNPRLGIGIGSRGSLQGLNPSVVRSCSPGKQCQNWTELLGTQLASENRSEWGRKHLHIWFAKCCEYGSYVRVKENSEFLADSDNPISEDWSWKHCHLQRLLHWLSCSPSCPMTPGTQHARPERNLRKDRLTRWFFRRGNWGLERFQLLTGSWSHSENKSLPPGAPGYHQFSGGFLHIMAWIVNSCFTWCPHCTVIIHWGQSHLSYWSWQTQCLS